MRTRYLALVAVLALSAACPAHAQPPDELIPAFASAQYAPNRFDAVERVDRACPGLVRQDHAFTDAVATVLNREDARWGRNGKRGNVNDPSHDALFYRGGPSPFGGAVVDIIVAAGGPDARPGWQDVTQATIDAGTVGVWVQPSGVLPACLSGGSTPPTPVDPPVTTPGLAETLAEIRSTQAVQTAMLLGIRERLDVLERQQTTGDLGAYIEAMVGAGPPGGTGPHVTDIKERLDVIRVSLEQLNAWLRSRTILRR
jgi:hypothetical protein